MNYKYSVSVILKNGFIDTKNSFLNQEKSIYEQTRNYILENEDDEDLRKLFTDFENNKNDDVHTTIKKMMMCCKCFSSVTRHKYIS